MNDVCAKGSVHSYDGILLILLSDGRYISVDSLDGVFLYQEDELTEVELESSQLPRYNAFLHNVKNGEME